MEMVNAAGWQYYFASHFVLLGLIYEVHILALSF